MSVLGIAFLVAFFTVGGVWGPLNDLAVVIQHLLMLPLAVALYELLRPRGPRLSLAGALVGIVGMLAVVVLQLMLVAGVFRFNQQIWMVIPAFLLVLVWFVINARLAGSSDAVPDSMPFSVVAWLYVGYPFWGYSVGRRLLASGAKTNG